MPFRPQALLDFFAALTAAITEDYLERTTKARQTGARQALRLLVVVLLAMFLTIAIVLMMIVGVNPQRTVRIYVPEAVTKLRAQQLSFGNTTEETWLCPCEQPGQSFSNYLPLTLIANMTSVSNNTVNIASTFSQFEPSGTLDLTDTLKADCYTYARQCIARRGRQSADSTQLFIQEACQTMLGVTASPRGTLLSSPYLSKPSIVWQAAASHTQSTISALVAYDTLLLDPDQRAGWYCIEDLLYLLSKIWFTLGNSTQTFPNAEQFIARASTVSNADMPLNQVFSFPPYIDNTSFPNTTTSVKDTRLYLTPEVWPIITFDWDAYVDGCQVLYCDVTRKTAISYRVFVGFSQIGGVLTIALVIVRMLVWPVIVRMLDWYQV